MEKRREMGLTIEELSEKAQISVSFLSYIETNKKIPSIMTVEKIANSLGIPVYQLFKYSNKKKINRFADFINSLTKKEKKMLLKFLELTKKEII